MNRRLHDQLVDWALVVTITAVAVIVMVATLTARLTLWKHNDIWIGTTELVDRWGIDRKTILAAIARGDIPSTKIGRTLLIPRAWVLEREGRPTTPTWTDIHADTVGI